LIANSLRGIKKRSAKLKYKKSFKKTRNSELGCHQNVGLFKTCL